MRCYCGKNLTSEEYLAGTCGWIKRSYNHYDYFEYNKGILCHLCSEQFTWLGTLFVKPQVYDIIERQRTSNNMQIIEDEVNLVLMD